MTATHYAQITFLVMFGTPALALADVQTATLTNTPAGPWIVLLAVVVARALVCFAESDGSGFGAEETRT